MPGVLQVTGGRTILTPLPPVLWSRGLPASAGLRSAAAGLQQLVPGVGQPRAGLRQAQPQRRWVAERDNGLLSRESEFWLPLSLAHFFTFIHLTFRPQKRQNICAWPAPLSGISQKHIYLFSASFKATPTGNGPGNKKIGLPVTKRNKHYFTAWFISQQVGHQQAIISEGVYRLLYLVRVHTLHWSYVVAFCAIIKVNDLFFSSCVVKDLLLREERVSAAGLQKKGWRIERWSNEDPLFVSQFGFISCFTN